MTRIVSFVIEGLAGREKPVRHELNADVNVFWGANGSGKTSMLRLLHSALADDTSDIDRIPFQSAEVNFYSEVENLIVSRRISKTEAKKSRKVVKRTRGEDGEILIEEISTPQYSWITTPSSENVSGKFRHQWLPITRISDEAIYRRRSTAQRAGQNGFLTESDFDRIFAEGIVDRWRDWSWKCSSKIATVQQDGLAAVLEVALRGVAERDLEVEPLAVDEAFALVSRFFGGKQAPARFEFSSYEEFKGLYRDDTILPDIVQRLQKVEEQITFARLPQTRLEELIKSLFAHGQNRTEVHFGVDNVRVTAHGIDIPLGQLSSGQRQLLLILLESLRGETSTIMVDEPELSMHVDWQQKLVASMRTINPEAQLIMATHSPEVMAEIDDRCVIEL